MGLYFSQKRAVVQLKGEEVALYLPLLLFFSQSVSELSYPTNRIPFDPPFPLHWGQIPFRCHANYVPVRSWSHPIIFPRRWFLHRQISSPDIYSVSGDANDFVYLLPVCVCVCGWVADGSAVWCLEGCMEMLAESCWSPACIHHSTSLQFPLSSLHLICCFSSSYNHQFFKNPTIFHCIFPQCSSHALFSFLSHSLHPVFLRS